MDPSSIAVIALALCLFAAFSRKAERSPLTPPMFFLAVGFFLGGEGLGWIHLDLDGEGIHVLAELTLVSSRRIVSRRVHSSSRSWR